MLRELTFELVDLFISAPPIALGRETPHALHEHASVPRPIEDRDVTSLRHVLPKSPQIRMRGLFGRRSRHRDHLILPRIERLRDAPDRAALSCSIDPFEREHESSLFESLGTNGARETTLQGGKLGLID